MMACAHITPSVSTKARSSSSKTCGLAHARPSTPRSSPFAHTGTIAAAPVPARIMAAPQSGYRRSSCSEHRKSGSPVRATSASGTGASSGSSSSAAFTSAGRPIACTTCSTVPPAPSLAIGCGLAVDGNAPNVMTTALVAPSAESACCSTRLAASAGSSASVSDPLSTDSARSRWLAPETSCSRAAADGGDAGESALRGRLGDQADMATPRREASPGAPKVMRRVERHPARAGERLAGIKYTT